MTVLGYLRQYLIEQGLVRAPDVEGVLPPAWRHPEGGAVMPGAAERDGLPKASWDTGTVVSLMHAPGKPPAIGAEARRIDSIDIYLRGTKPQDLVALEAQLRNVLLGTDPGGKLSWDMAGLYVVQTLQYKPFAPIGTTADGVYSFVVGYTFETLVA